MPVDLEELRDDIQKRMYGWWGGNAHSCYVLGNVVNLNKYFNHLEIGTLFGATAIYAARIMESNDSDGKVYTVDPCLYELHEPCSIRAGNINPDLVLHQAEIIQENIKLFGMEDRIVFINKSSHPLTKEVKQHCYYTCFIDGDHQNGTPLIDVKNCIKLGIYNIVLDDTHYRYPQVIDAMQYIIGLPGWTTGLSHNCTSAFYRFEPIEPPYAEATSDTMDLTKYNWPEFMEDYAKLQRFS
jgi:hypothetical protein